MIGQARLERFQVGQHQSASRWVDGREMVDASAADDFHLLAAIDGEHPTDGMTASALGTVATVLDFTAIFPGGRIRRESVRWWSYQNGKTETLGLQ